MQRKWNVLVLCALLVSQGCAESAGPVDISPEVPRDLIVPRQAPITVAAQGGPSFAIEPTEEIPPEYQQAAMVSGFTSVDIDGWQATGHAETEFLATSATQNMSVTVSVDGSTVGSDTFEEAYMALLPYSGRLAGDGVVAAPACGATTMGKTVHEAKIGYKGADLSVTRTTSTATPRYQAACQTTTETDTSASGGGTSGGSGGFEEGGGYILTICTTTRYYSASGEYLYSSRACRQEYHDQ